MKPVPLTRAEGRRRRAAVPEAGVYGVDAMDAGALTWRGRYLCWAETADQARERIRAAGFRKKQLYARWTPRHPPPDGVPAGLGPGVAGWYRSREVNFVGEEWEVLPASYQHPSQARAAADPELR